MSEQEIKEIMDCLNKRGCEFGRSLALSDKYSKEKIISDAVETNEDLKEIKETLKEIKTTQSNQEVRHKNASWEHYLSIAVIDLIITGIGMWIFANVLVGAFES